MFVILNKISQHPHKLDAVIRQIAAWQLVVRHRGRDPFFGQKSVLFTD